MPGKSLLLTLVVSTFAIVPASQAATREIIPAGTLLSCTVSEPNFSPKTVQIGDPVLCHLGPVGAFGRPLFPRGAELGGHLEDAKSPGHLVGKGWMQIEFDRLILPGAEIYPLAAKLTTSPHMKVDAEGKIHGKGHPVRDSVEWAIPILWPIKIITLANRGPYPALKGETRLSLRLMEDVEVPNLSAHNVPMPPWASPSAYHTSAYSVFRPASASLQEEPQVLRISYSQPAPQQAPVSTPPATQPAPQAMPEPTLTVLAMTGGEAYLAREYWVQGGQVHCISAEGEQKVFPLDAVDLYQTASLNRQRNVKFVLQSKDAAEPKLQQQ